MLALLALGGCAGGLPGSSGPPPTFDLTAPRGAQAGGRPRGQLVVAEPTALSVLNSDRIVVRTEGDQMQLLANAQWSDRLPKLLQTRLVEAFENANRLKAVGTPADRLSADFQLVTDVRAFELSVVAARVFRATVPAQSTDARDAAVALDQAFHQVATDLVQWASHQV